VGLLEIVSEVGRIISFSFRLFGNIFAGSVLLAVFAFLVPVAATILFVPFEIFVAFVQALVFSLLTLVFLEIGTTSHSHDHGEEAAHGALEAPEHAEAATH
jgi:F-type H+-transporting ATPase subunit a